MRMKLLEKLNRMLTASLAIDLSDAFDASIASYISKSDWIKVVYSDELFFTLIFIHTYLYIHEYIYTCLLTGMIIYYDVSSFRP